MTKTEPRSLISLPHQTLIAPLSPPHLSQITIYFDHDSQLYSVKLPAEALTTSSAITRAIEKLNSYKGIDLVLQCTQYQLYAAKKSGKRKTDLPAIQSEQLLLNTGIKRFALHPIYKLPALMETKESLSSIQSEISLRAKAPKESFDISEPPAGKTKGFFRCLCLNKS